jgi:type II secretory pathway component PulC
MKTLKTSINAPSQELARTDRDNRDVRDSRKAASLLIFGKQVSTTNIVPVPTKVPATRLKLTLYGVVASDRENLSKAIVGVDGKKPELHGLGDSVPNTNAIIHAISPERILLNRNGKFESLVIDRPKLENHSAQKSVNRATGIEDKLLIIDIPEQTQNESTTEPPRNIDAH